MRFIRIFRLIIEIRVNFIIIKRTGIIEIGRNLPTVKICQPSFSEPGRKRQSPVIFKPVSWIRLRIEVINTEIEGHLLGSPFQSFCKIKEFASHICFQTGIPVISTSPTFYFHQTTCQIAIFYRWNATYHLYFLDIIGRDATHIHSGIHIFSGCCCCIPRPSHILHIGIGTDGSSIYYKTRSEGSGSIS